MPEREQSVAAIPPKAPAAMRAAMRLYVPVAKAPVIVARPRPHTETVRAERRSQRSRSMEPRMPMTVADAV